MISKVNQSSINHNLHNNTKEERAREQGGRREKGKGRGKGSPTNQKEKTTPKPKHVAKEKRPHVPE